MLPQQTAELTRLKNQLVDGLETYRKAVGSGCDYAVHDILACTDIIDVYLTAVGQHRAGTHSEIMMGDVQRAVVRLNKLNASCHGGLIETDQREQICEIINKAARYAGLEFSGTDDIAEVWREW